MYEDPFRGRNLLVCILPIANIIMKNCHAIYVSIVIFSISGCGNTPPPTLVKQSPTTNEPTSAEPAITPSPSSGPTVGKEPPSASPTSKVDFSSLDAKGLIAYSKSNSIAIDVDDDFHITFYPQDTDKRFVAAVIGLKDDVIRELKPNEWIKKELVGKWEYKVPNQVSTINIRSDGLLQLDRQDSNLLMRALNNTINGTILYQWSFNEGNLQFKNVASEKQLLDKVRFLSDSEKTKLEMKGKNSFSLTDPNGLGMGEWTRIGR